MAFAVGVTLLFYLPRLLDLSVGPETRRGVYLGAGQLLGAALLLVSLNDYVMGWLRSRPVWQDVALTFLVNLCAVAAFSILAFRLHLVLYDIDIAGLLRRAYRIRFAMTALLAVPYVRYLHYRGRSQCAELENLRLRERKAEARLSALQQKLDPHFLFNTLNTIGGAVRQDRREASLSMIADLAERYRYLLRVSDRSLVTVAEELDFVEGYARLLAHRFGDNFRLHSRISPYLRPRLLPPLTLQLLVENAVKHNELSRQRPLEIWIDGLEENRLQVRNTYQLRGGTDGAGEGLANLSERYTLLAGAAARPVVERDETYFSVTLQTLDDARPTP